MDIYEIHFIKNKKPVRITQLDFVWVYLFLKIYYFNSVCSKGKEVSVIISVVKFCTYIFKTALIII